MKKSSSGFRLLILSLVLCLFACAKAPPKVSLDALSRERAEHLLSALTQSSQQFKGLKAFAQVRVQSGGRVETFDAAVLINPPRQLRIEIMDDLGQTRARLIADGTQVHFEDLQRGTEDNFEQNDKALQKTLHLPIPIEEFIARMLLRIPEAALTGAEPARLMLQNFDLDVEPQLPRLKAVKKIKGPGAYQIAYGNYSSSPASAYPQEIAWSFKNPKIDLRLSLKDLATDQSISPSKFQVSQF